MFLAVTQIKDSRVLTAIRDRAAGDVPAQQAIDQLDVLERDGKLKAYIPDFKGYRGIWTVEAPLYSGSGELHEDNASQYVEAYILMSWHCVIVFKTTTSGYCDHVISHITIL